MDSKAELEVTEGNLMSCTENIAVQGSLLFLLPQENHQGATELCLTLPKYCKTFDSLN